MKLIYCWIPQYLNIKNQGFNFGSEWIYSTNENPDSSLTIIRKKNDKFISDFFKLNSKGFENVTAIVGENGAGKSNILEYLGRLITIEDTDGIKIKRDGSSEKVKPQEGVLIFTDDSENIIIKSNGNSISVSIPHKEYSNKSIIANHVIYYSPIYDFRNLNLSENSHYSDISSNFLINKDSQNDISLIDRHF